MTYHGLADGEHSFAVEATDGAGNQQLTPTEFSWTVDNSLLDTTAPETTIDSGPPDPSGSASANFTYSSNEPGSSFECSLDNAPFSPCAATGISYGGLASGPHVFQVRATDPSDNTDQTPAGYSFNVVLAFAPSTSPPVQPPAAAPAAGGKVATARPETTLVAKPSAKTHDRTPTFRFRSSARSASFQCQLDHSAFKPCKSPLTTKSLAPGRHTLKVRAVLDGVADPTPTSFSFRVEHG